MKAIAGIFRKYPTIFGYLAVLFGLWLSGLHSYILFHCLAEIFSIVAACCIFLVAWNSRRLVENSCPLFIGTAYLFVGGLDLVHMLGYSGMGILGEHGANLATQAWVSARYMESLSLLAAPLFLTWKPKPDQLLVFYFIVSSLLLLLIFTDTFPDCFMEGTGPTLFKKTSEYIVSLILCGAIAFMFARRDAFDAQFTRIVCASVFLTIFSELSFALYADPYGFFNRIGHFLKLISFHLIYKALMDIGLKRPCETLFRNLSNRERELEEAKDGLEKRVGERTAELVRTNTMLEQEIIERKKIEQKLRESEARYRELFMTSLDGIAVTDPEGRLLDCNPAYVRLLGYDSVEQLKSRPFFEWTAPEFRENDAKIGDNQIFRLGFCKDYEKEYIRKNGERIPVSLQACLRHDLSGRPVGMWTIVRDISERKRADKRLRRHRRELESKVALRTRELSERNTELQNEIEERKRAEAALEKQKKELRIILDSVPALIFYKDLENRLVRVNRKWSESTGFPVEEASGKFLHEIFSPEQAEDLFQNDIEIIKSGKAKTGIVEEMDTDRGLRCFATDKVPYRDDQGNIAGVIGFSLDITRQKRAERELKLTQARLMALLDLYESIDNSPDKLAGFAVEKAVEMTRSEIGFVGFIDSDEKIMIGHVCSENSMAQCSFPEKPATFEIESAGLWAEAVRRRMPIIVNDYDSQFLMKKGLPDGHVKINRFMAVPVLDRDRVVSVAVVGNKGTAYDDSDIYHLKLLMEGMWHIVERKRLEEDLDRFFNISIDMMCIAGLDGYFKVVNPAFTKALGFSAENLMEKPFMEFIHPEDRPSSACEMQKLSEEISVIDFENRYICTDGSYKWLAWTAVPVLQNNLIYAVARDMTDRKNAEQRIRDALGEKEAMLAEIHHRVKNNLQIISSLLDFQADYVDDSRTLEVLLDSRRRVHSMALIHAQLYGSPNLERIDFGSYVQALTAELLAAYRSVSDQISLFADVQDITLEVKQAIPCGLIINELVSNALKYAFPDSGNVENKEIRISFTKENDSLYALEVADNGVGLPSDFVFPNEKTLGMFLIETFIEQLHGTADWKSGGGTSCRIFFKA